MEQEKTRPAFAQSLVGDYGSSSEDEDGENGDSASNPVAEIKEGGTSIKTSTDAVISTAKETEEKSIEKTADEQEGTKSITSEINVASVEISENVEKVTKVSEEVCEQTQEEATTEHSEELEKEQITDDISTEIKSFEPISGNLTQESQIANEIFDKPSTPKLEEEVKIDSSLPSPLPKSDLDLEEPDLKSNSENSSQKDADSPKPESSKMELISQQKDPEPPKSNLEPSPENIEVPPLSKSTVEPLIHEESSEFVSKDPDDFDFPAEAESSSDALLNAAIQSITASIMDDTSESVPADLPASSVREESFDRLVEEHKTLQSILEGDKSAPAADSEKSEVPAEESSASPGSSNSDSDKALSNSESDEGSASTERTADVETKVSAKKNDSQPSVRRLRQIRHPSVKAAEAAADAAFVAAVTPTRKNLKEAKIARAIANVSIATNAASASKKKLKETAQKKAIRSSSTERLGEPVVVIQALNVQPLNVQPLTSVPEKMETDDEVSSPEESPSPPEEIVDKVVVEKEEIIPKIVEPPSVEESTLEKPKEKYEVLDTDAEKQPAIKLRISKESLKMVDPPLKKLELQIPADSSVSESSPSPGGTRRIRKIKDNAASPSPPLSPLTLKIAKSKEGLEVVSNEVERTLSEADSCKIEKITLKLVKDDNSACIVKPGQSSEDFNEPKPDKIIIKLPKTDSSISVKDDGEENKLEKIRVKLSKEDGACIIKKTDSSEVSESEGGKLGKLTFKKSADNNISIVRPKENPVKDSSVSSSEGGRLDKLTIKVSNDTVRIVKPTSPVPPVSRLDEEVGSGRLGKITLKVAKDGTAAVRSRDDSPSSSSSSREAETTSKLDKITIKLSKDDGTMIVKPSSPVPDRKTLKLPKDDAMAPLSPLLIGRTEEGERERIKLTLSKAGGHPSPIGDDRSSWSIKSADDVAASPDSVTPKTKRKLIETSEGTPPAAKKLKMTEPELVDDSDDIEVVGVYKTAPEESEVIGQPSLISGVTPITHSVKKELIDDVPKSQIRALKRAAEDTGAVEAKKIKPDDTGSAWTATRVPEVVDVELEASQSAAAQAPLPPMNISVIDLEEEIPTSIVVKKKPRGRPRKTVLTPGSIPMGVVPPPPSDTDESPSKSKKKLARVEPVESTRPKRLCKGRERPPPKPEKPPKEPKVVKPRGKAAALLKAKQALAAKKLEAPQLFEEETRMSADSGSRSQISAGPTSVPLTSNLIHKVLKCPPVSTSVPSTPGATPAPSPGPVQHNEESQGSIVSSTTTESTPNKGNRKGRMEIVVDPDAKAEFTVDMIAEYTWPLTEGRGGETYMIQEQISEYLGVKSFKRKYPTMVRRFVDHDERQYLLERKLVSESLCDLGLTAVSSHEALDVMVADFPEKYEEYRRYIRDRAAREFSTKQKTIMACPLLGKEDSKSKAIRSMANFNAALNRARREQRRCCFDLQNFSVHYPENRRRKYMTAHNIPKVGNYPLALVRGQFTDYYKEYTPAELRYFPVNTVLYGPLLPHEQMQSNPSAGSDGSQSDSSSSSSSSSSSDSDSSGSESDSDSGSSSDSEDEASNQTANGTAESQDSDVEQETEKCRVCEGDKMSNKSGCPEPLVECANCRKSGHPSCMDLTVEMVPHIRKYSWQCTDCKLCVQCNDTADEDKMLFCDMCDRGYHIYCVGLRKVPDGRWHCKECALCSSCGAKDPGGTDEQQASTAATAGDTPTKQQDVPQWQHEFKKGDKNTRVYVRTLCVPCSKLWKKGRYCRLCWKCYGNQPEEEGLINCSICDRWMHADCCRKAGRVIDMDKLNSFLCELCQQKGVRVSLCKLQFPIPLPFKAVRS